MIKNNEPGYLMLQEPKSTIEEARPTPTTSTTTITTTKEPTTTTTTSTTQSSTSTTTTEEDVVVVTDPPIAQVDVTEPEEPLIGSYKNINGILI